MYNFDNIDKFIVQQKKEWGEILTGIETKNKYKVFDSNGNELFLAFESKSNFFLRQLLKASRPFTMNINENEKKIFEIKRPFRWIFQEASICDSNNKELAVIKMEFSFFQRRYNVFTQDNSLVFKIFGPFFKPWTFNIIENDKVIGKITKKWSGALKEMFTDADNFGAEFPMSWSSEKKAIALGAIFLIDLVHFESKS